MNFIYKDLEGLSERDQINGEKFIRWYFTWAAMLAIAIIVLGPEEEGLAAVPLWHWILGMVPIIPGFLCVLAYLKFINHADELLRRIHIEALATGCGAGIIVGTILAMTGNIVVMPERAGIYIWLVIILTFSFRLGISLKRFHA